MVCRGRQPSKLRYTHANSWSAPRARWLGGNKMAAFAVGDLVRVQMPKGVNKRGVVGISVMYTTWPEARFDGATGDVVEINPRGTLGIPLYLVSFRDHENRVAVPWQSQWFREEWLAAAGERHREEPATAGALVAAAGFQETTVGRSS